LFGVPYMLFLAVPSQYIDPTLEIVKLYFEMTFNSFNVCHHVAHNDILHCCHPRSFTHSIHAL